MLEAVALVVGEILPLWLAQVQILMAAVTVAEVQQHPLLIATQLQNKREAEMPTLPQ